MIHMDEEGAVERLRGKHRIVRGAEFHRDIVESFALHALGRRYFKMAQQAIGGDPSALAQSIGAAIRTVDPEQPIYDARPLDEVVDRSLAQRWLQTALLGAFAAMAILLASIGVYGVIAYGVGQRTREFGIRVALGARRGAIVRGVMGRGAALFGAGAAVGLAAAAASARVLSALLFNVGALDVFSFAAATLVLFAVALAASGIPARRAAAVDPSVALRAE